VDSGAFRSRTLFWLVSVASLSLLSALFWMVFGGAERGQPYGPNSFSRSAVGHEAFVRLLRETGTPVVTARWDSGGRAGLTALLMLLEPRPAAFRFQNEEALENALARARRVLLVLPKRNPLPDEDNPAWVGDAPLRDAADVARLLATLDIDGEVVRCPAGRWNTGEIGIAPTISGQVQVIRSPSVRPLVSCAEGTLIGTTEVRGTTIYLLTDPDVIATHGLLAGDNAALATTLVGWARSGLETAVVDETFHGYLREPSIWRALFEFPLVLATVQAALSLVVLLWAAMGRFGAPQPVRPPLEPGKAFLIDNIASLLRYGGHAAHALRRYVEGARADVALRLHVPTSLQPHAAREWLDRYGAQRGVATTLTQLEREAQVGGGDAARTVAVARAAYRWKEEMIHGPAGGT